MTIFDLINRLGDKEETITEKEIVSPVFFNDKIVTRIEGLIYYLNIPKIKPGWYKFKPIDSKNAEPISGAHLDEIERYLKNFPKIRIILTHKRKHHYLGIPLKSNRLNFSISEMLPVLLFNDMAMNFSRCICRFDGQNLWFQDIDISDDFEKTEYLKNCLENFTDPKKIKFPGLSIEDKVAYSIKYTIDIKENEEFKKTKIQRDVEYAGGKFLKSEEKSDFIEVKYKVDDQEFTSYVSKDINHKIITAGICLEDYETGHSGDTDYDLKSIISVIKEGQEKGQIHKTLR